MTTPNLEPLRYPIGRFKAPENFNQTEISAHIETLEQLPERLEALVENLSDDQLDTPYRPEGWTVRQLIHHIADSHSHSYIRFKWSLTEDTPLIKAYNEQDWSELFDAKSAPVEMSLQNIKATHARLVYLLRGLNDADLKKSFIHPEHGREVPLWLNISLYAWHSDHHYAHIKNLMLRMGWD